MNELQLLGEDIRKRFPNATLQFDPAPERSIAGHWLDIKHGDKTLTIEWRSARGFGFYANDSVLYEGPEKVITDREQALQEVVNRIG